MGLIVSCQGKMATADEIRIAHEIMKAVRRLQLPLKLDEITEGREKKILDWIWIQKMSFPS